jgi:hypothetical protein
MEPYQEASQAMVRQANAPVKALKTGIGLAASYASYGAGANILSRILPFLNKYIAPSVAVKGISKIDPRIGKAVDQAFKVGYPSEEIGTFFKNKIDGEEGGQEPQEMQSAPQSELSRESLMQQFQEGQAQEASQGQGQGKAALGPLLAEAVQILRRMKQGG